MTSLPSPSLSSPPTLTRWYIDTRPLTATTQSLPLLSTLQESDQTTVKAFYHLSDRHMSLASYLLKYLFIHRTCRVPWNQIIISRTPAPHKRPCYIPPQQPQPQQSGGDNKNPKLLISIPNIEFNADPRSSCSGGGSSNSSSSRTMTASLQDSITHRTRLFYTYWALKEAYIKMTGEALLAPWLRDLEFINVTVPMPPPLSPYPPAPSLWGVPETGVRAMLYGREVPEVRLEVVAFGNDYVFATAARGSGFGNSVGEEGGMEGEGRVRWDDFRLVDIERDVGPCARGECGCLN
ncbi:hypothetical protein EMCG_01655 [[Emmonsia] crescens]|uniref:holo-[acyl-carrier-protein] synthase n=1 Tax=[Emmonsia] crescens TaxID=73230 RepID=A0A0G2J2C6_9EURO|nr:hypothetical protein EMCG_01655 [Emmonsia crescens UAMH 3008]